jgi:hypothetical protein
MSGDCEGLRLVVGNDGFALLNRSDGTRQTCAVHDVLLAMDSATGSKGGRLKSAVVSEKAALKTLRAELKTGQISEGVAARKLCMLIGPPIEIAVAAAVAAGVATGVKSASKAGPEEESGGSQSRPCTGSKRKGPDQPLLLPVRRRSKRLENQAEASESTGLTPALYSVDLLSFDDDLPTALPEKVAIANASAAFKQEEATKRAKALLNRAARRQEAAEMVQATWRMRS